MSDAGLTLLDERSVVNSNSYQMLLSVEPGGDVIGRVIEQFGAWLRARKNWDPPPANIRRTGRSVPAVMPAPPRS